LTPTVHRTHLLLYFTKSNLKTANEVKFTETKNDDRKVRSLSLNVKIELVHFY